MVPPGECLVPSDGPGDGACPRLLRLLLWIIIVVNGVLELVRP